RAITRAIVPATRPVLGMVGTAVGRTRHALSEACAAIVFQRLRVRSAGRIAITSDRFTRGVVVRRCIATTIAPAALAQAIARRVAAHALAVDAFDAMARPTFVGGSAGFT